MPAVPVLVAVAAAATTAVAVKTLTTTQPGSLGFGGGSGGSADPTLEKQFEALQVANAQLQAQATDASTQAIVSENKAVLETETAKSLFIYSGAALIAVLAFRKLKL